MFIQDPPRHNRASSLHSSISKKRIYAKTYCYIILYCNRTNDFFRSVDTLYMNCNEFFTNFLFKKCSHNDTVYNLHSQSYIQIYTYIKTRLTCQLSYYVMHALFIAFIRNDNATILSGFDCSVSRSDWHSLLFALKSRVSQLAIWP